MNGAARWLTWLLRASALVMLPAFGAALLPTDWMARNHAWIGLGEFPRGPLVDYLTRTISLLYGIHGALLWVLARDVRRHAEVIAFVGAADIVFGAAALWIDLRAPMPWWWTACEGPPILINGVVVLALVARVRGAAAA